MKSIRLTLSLFAATMGALVASAQQAPASAVLTQVSGDVTVTVPGSTAAKPAVVGQKLPEGSTVTTAGGSIAIVESFEGIETGLASSTTAVIGTHSVNAQGVRTAVIDVKQGSSISVLDPSKRAVNNYSVKTPKGVAAARGTTYSTTVKLNGSDVVVTVDTLTGLVNFAGTDVAAGNSGTAGVVISIDEEMKANREATAPVLMDMITVLAMLTQQNPAMQSVLDTIIIEAMAADLKQEEVNIAKDLSGLVIQSAKADPTTSAGFVPVTFPASDPTIVSPSS